MSPINLIVRVDGKTHSKARTFEVNSSQSTEESRNSDVNDSDDSNVAIDDSDDSDCIESNEFTQDDNIRGSTMLTSMKTPQATCKESKPRKNPLKMVTPTSYPLHPSPSTNAPTTPVPVTVLETPPN